MSYVFGVVRNVLAALIGCFLLGLFISNTATAVSMALVASALATELGLSQRAFAMTVVLASLATFITPVSSPVNALVIGSGSDRFVDFIRIGLPLCFMVMTTGIVLIRLMYPYAVSNVLLAAVPDP